MLESNADDSTPVPGMEIGIEKLADLCAVGAYPIPSDLPDDQQRKLLVGIAARRRKRLINLFAAAIAEDIWRERQTLGTTDVKTNF